MTGSDLTRMFEMSYLAIKRNLEDLTHGDSIVAPQNGGNCLNWVLGHVVLTRNTMLQLTGGSPVMAGEAVNVYKRGSLPCGSDGYLDLATLRGFLDDSQQQLMRALAALSDKAVASPVPPPYNRPPLSGSLGEALIRLHYHEAYHNGQMGLLRRIAGKEGAIK
jgi:hypothetical protein